MAGKNKKRKRIAAQSNVVLPKENDAKLAGSQWVDQVDTDSDEKYAAELTRTVQASLEKITSAMADYNAQNGAKIESVPDRDSGDVEDPVLSAEPIGKSAAGESEESRGTEQTPQKKKKKQSFARRIGSAAGRGVLGITRWLLLVLFFVVVIAAFPVLALYRQATVDLIPQVNVTLDGQVVQPTAYDWKIPVVSHLLFRNYQEVLSTEPIALAQPIGNFHPDLVITPQEYETSLVLKNSSGSVVFQGSAMNFREFLFEEEGTYTASLMVSNDVGNYESNEVEGTQTYDFQFDLKRSPAVQLNTEIAMQGDVVALSATSFPEGSKLTLDCPFPSIGFVPSSNGWCAYIAIPMDAEPNVYSLTVEGADTVENLMLTVRKRAWREISVQEEKDLEWAYIGQDNTPEAVLAALRTSDETIYWGKEGFSLPFAIEVKTRLTYGDTEKVVRADTGAGGHREEEHSDTDITRRSINLVLEGIDGTDILAPAEGRVVLAEDLGGEPSADHGVLLPNNTIVIDHGGGIKTVFYNIKDISVRVGDMVKQGQTIAKSRLTLCIGAYVSDVAVDPFSLWQSHNDAVSYY